MDVAQDNWNISDGAIYIYIYIYIANACSLPWGIRNINESNVLVIFGAWDALVEKKILSLKLALE